MIGVLLLFVNAAAAYIPEYSMIATRAADQHGKGSYQIEQDVTLRKGSESYTVHESWLVGGENSLRVTLEGRGPLKGLVAGTVLYEGNSRIFFDGTLRSQKLGDEWWEPIFHFRNSRYFRSKLVSLKIAPPDSLKDRPPLTSDGEIKYEPPRFIRISRAGGGPAWAIGLNPTSGESPTLWLEQDQFVVRKMRNLNQTVMRADDYAKFDENFWYPRSRVYQFGGFTVQIQTVRAQSVSAKAATDPRFKGSSVAAERDALKLPDVDGLREFYQRFR